MAINRISPYSSTLRLSGLVSGLDTDQIVSDLMRVERMPLDRLVQKRQLAEWRRDAYREIINLLRSFKDEYFDRLRPNNYMLSQSTYKKFKINSTDNSVVTAEALSSAVVGTHTIVVQNIATADTAASSGKVTKSLLGTPTSYSLSGKTIKITLDGVTKELTLDDYTSLDDMISKSGTGLQALVDSAFGTGKIVVSNESGSLKFDTAGGATKITLGSGSLNDALSLLGFTPGASNRLDMSQTLGTLADRFSNGLSFDEDGYLEFSINGQDFKFHHGTTLSDMLTAINTNQSAKVNISYDEVTDKFIITAKQTGAGDNIRITQTGGTFFTDGGTMGATGIDLANPIVEADGGRQGMDATVIIDGQEIKRSSNSFVINDIKYTILKEGSEQQTITVTQDVEGVYEAIKNFVDKYNEVISKINAKLSEKYDRDYQPLTDEQKEAMSEDDIKRWEEKAKKGLLRNDRLLQDIVYKMRKALSDAVEGVGLTLNSIGIKTGPYEDRGKLTIDDTALKDAISKNPDEVMNLFAKESDIWSNIDLTPEQRSERYSNEGLAYRIFDIIEENIRTIRDSSDKKGVLLEKAGIEGDASEYSNLIYKEIYNYEIDIAELSNRLIEKEERYYAKFTAMEKILASMNAQSSWLISQLGQYGQ